MPNSFYNHGTAPIGNSSGSSSLIRTEFDAITAGFTLFPTLSGNGNRPLVINAGGTAVTVTTGTLSLAGNFATTGAFNTTFVQQASVTLTLPSTSMTLLTDASAQGFIWGVQCTNDAGDLVNDIGISVGSAASGDTVTANITFLPLTSALIKRLDATWVTGTNQGGRTSSQAIADTTWHVFLMLVAGVVDVGFDTSVTGANLVTDHSATKVRRIASILREAGSIVLFTQVGDYFFRDSVQSVSTANPGTAGVTATVSTPLGVTNIAILTGILEDSAPSGVLSLLFTALTQTDSTASTSNNQLQTDTGDTIMMQSGLEIRTNTSSQIRYRLSSSSATRTVRINTNGWIDTRGQYS